MGVVESGDSPGKVRFGVDVDAWLTRMYERHGGRYVTGCIGALCIIVAVVSVLGGAVAGRYVGISFEHAALLLLVLGAVLAPAVGSGVWATRGMLRTLTAWADGREEKSNRVEVLRTALRFPSALVRNAAWRVLLVTPLSAGVVYGSTKSGFDEELAVLALLGSLFLILYGLALGYHMLNAAMRPLRREVGVAMTPEYFAAARSLSITAKLLLSLGAAALVLGFLVASTVLPSGSSGSGARRAIVITILLVTTVGVSLALPLARGMLAPVGDLIRGTDAVRAGNLDVVVPVTSTDELGELATRFNEMVAGLRERESLRGRNLELVEELQASRARIVAASDEARRRVERDLHDGAQQNLVLLNLKLGLAERAAADDPELHAIVEEARAELTRALDELRDLAHGIYPAVLTSDGLPGALAEVVEQAPIAAGFESDGAGRYPAEIEAAVYFCCLEALQNAAKHAGASARVLVKLGQRDGQLRFEVADDGAGFDAVAASSSAGLQNMADRIGALGGLVSIDSAPGGGTTVRGTVPIGG